jgi:hypothetical protein
VFNSAAHCSQSARHDAASLLCSAALLLSMIQHRCFAQQSSQARMLPCCCCVAAGTMSHMAPEVSCSTQLAASLQRTLGCTLGRSAAHT